MIYRTLGKTGLRVSVTGIETHQWSGMGGRDFSTLDIASFLARARELGINFIDTGECYRDHAAERHIGGALGDMRGDFIAKRGERSEGAQAFTSERAQAIYGQIPRGSAPRRLPYILATKFGHIGAIEDRVSGWSRTSIIASLNRSLEALGTNSIDIFQAHIYDSGDVRGFLASLGEVRSALEEARSCGKIRWAGISLGDNELIADAGVCLGRSIAELDIAIVQVPYSRLFDEARESVFPLAKDANLGVIVRAPLAKGYLSSTFKPKKDYDETLLSRAREYIYREVPTGVESAEWAIAWCLRDPIVGTVVPGCSALEQLDSTARATNLVEIS